MDRHTILLQARQAGIKLVRFLYCGNDGLIRGKTTAIEALDGALEAGIGLTVAMQSFTMLDRLVPGGTFGPVGEIRLVPDLDTFAMLPYAPKSARLLVDLLQLDHTPWPICPRSFLKRMIAKADARGLQVVAAFENEFYLARVDNEGRFVPFDRSNCFSSIGMDSANPIVIDIVEALEKQGIAVQQYYPELGPGQQEISVQHTTALCAADQQLALRETVRGVAASHGVYASFAPKPFPDQAGSGCHIHFSLWDTASGQNVLSDPAGPYGISPLGQHAIGGVLAHLRGLLALTAPTVNSYRRLQPRFWSSAYCCYGPDNREAALRIPSLFWGREAASTNFELKPCDPSCNPYLALGAVIAACLDGIERGLEPPEAVTLDPATLAEEERERLGVYRLPLTLEEALAALEQDEVLTEALGSPLAHEYLLVKRAESEAFKDQGLEFELDQHFYKY
ncbi:MAG TPA: glutamine synthetase family protein [Candidatus Tectomicrobia bacterium]|nr:glutamine synthetase family protein [Candidatus Tectomicrobia bacterium]